MSDQKVIVEKLNRFNKEFSDIKEELALFSQALNQMLPMVYNAMAVANYLMTHCPVCRKTFEVKEDNTGLVLPGDDPGIKKRYYWCPECKQKYFIEGINIKDESNNTGPKS